ncbi:MAG: hypothetical protein FWD57_15865 [Polyangiaceae bacterium]|nr:hypothetical protein [Polyangiaceae bacterium]
MIHKWEYSDGTTVRWTNNGVILIGGDGYLAANLRSILDEGVEPRIQIVSPPGGTIRLDRASLWLVDTWLRQTTIYAWAWGPIPHDYVDRRGHLVSSTYTRSDEDMPPHVAKMVRDRNKWMAEHGGNQPGKIH